MGAGLKLAMWLILTVAVGLHLITETQAKRESDELTFLDDDDRITGDGSGDGSDGTTPATPAPTAAATVAFGLTFSSPNDRFTADLLDLSSPRSRNRSRNLDAVYRGNPNTPGYMRSMVVRYRNGSVSNDVRLLFRNSSSLPQNSTIANTFVQANNSGLDINPSSVVVTTPTRTAAAPATTAAAPPPTAAAPPTTAATPAPTTALSTATIVLNFTTNGTFIPPLLDPTSAQFMAKKRLVEGIMSPAFQTLSGFLNFTTNGFSPGSIIVTNNIIFLSTSVPNNMEIVRVVIAASNNTALNINTTSITVDGVVTVVSSGASHKISLIAPSVLVLLSWLLSSQH
ncbi:probable maltase-glucoamylase 2 isoform X2 [Brachionichthys hirsutus]|uniref:probable maltase-glucoamylase 2 isoform X2 n=1 Tax=Brachionichthys hirsutus TaxID=412623 RepID=UPI0036051B9E